MTAPGNGPLFFIFMLCVVVSSGYAVGRLHQWHRQGRERDEAYRTGYDKASRSIIGMMTETRSAGPVPAGAPLGGHSHVRRARPRGDRIIVNQRQLYPAHHDPAQPASGR